MSVQGDKPCKVAIVGAGAMAREHIKAFQDVPGVTIAGVANRTVAKAQALADEFGIPVVASDAHELYTRTKADIVQISVYETAINAVAKACFEHPWDVFMEKPVGLNLEDAEDISAHAHRLGRRVWVGLNRRALSSSRCVMKDLSEHATPRFIHVQDQQSLETAWAIGHAQSVVDNWMYANSIHLVDYLLAFGRGEVVEVATVSKWDAANPDVVLAKVSFSSGDLGLYEAIWNGPGPWACTVTSEHRRWELRPLEQAVYQNRGERALNSVPVDDWDVKFKPGVRRQAEDVVRAWRGESNVLVPSLAEAMRGMRLVKDIYGV